MSNIANFPDWEPKVLRKKSAQKTIFRKSSPKKEKDSDEDPKKPNKISRQLCTEIQQARTKQKMKQKDLARLCNVPVQTIAQYENGKVCPPDNRLVHKMSRVLKTKFTVWT